MSTIKVEIDKPAKIQRVSTIKCELADHLDYEKFRRKYGCRPEGRIPPWPRHSKRDK
jgi:hypothetical protein